MEIDIKHACSFTGHRPERLEMPPGGTKETIEYAKKNGREVVVINRYR